MHLCCHGSLTGVVPLIEGVVSTLLFGQFQLTDFLRVAVGNRISETGHPNRGRSGSNATSVFTLCPSREAALPTRDTFFDRTSVRDLQTTRCCRTSEQALPKPPPIGVREMVWYASWRSHRVASKVPVCVTSWAPELGVYERSARRFDPPQPTRGYPTPRKLVDRAAGPPLDPDHV